MTKAELQRVNERSRDEIQHEGDADYSHQIFKINLLQSETSSF